MDSSKNKIQLNHNDLIKLKETALDLFKQKSAPLGYQESNTAFIWLESTIDLLNKKGINVQIEYRTKG